VNDPDTTLDQVMALLEAHTKHATVGHFGRPVSLFSRKESPRRPHLSTTITYDEFVTPTNKTIAIRAVHEADKCIAWVVFTPTATFESDSDAIQNLTRYLSEP
jgi:hypothetical protein